MAVDAASLEAAMAIENRNQLMTAASPNFPEGMRAFLEKRRPDYIPD
jgi:enoyl-CoA hydratase/carnithine racemase